MQDPTQVVEITLTTLEGDPVMPSAGTMFVLHQTQAGAIVGSGVGGEDEDLCMVFMTQAEYNSLSASQSMGTTSLE